MTDFEQIFSQNRELIHRYLWKLCGRADLAEELTQETFFKAYMNLPSVRKESSIPAWLCQIAKNSYFAWCRQQKKQVYQEEMEELPGGAEPERLYLQKEMTDEAMQALNDLEEPYRKVLILSIFGEMPLKSISEIFGKSESWARVTFYRAKQKILERIR